MDSDTTDLGSVWIAKVAADEAVAVSNLRGLPKVDAATAEGAVWLRGESEENELPAELVRIQADVFRLRPPDGLAAWGSEIPVARLPELDWQPLNEVTRPLIESPLLPGQVGESMSLSLVKSVDVDREPNVLLVSLALLVKWVGSTAEIRFENLRFAAGYDGTAVIRGTPIPSLPGARFVEVDGVAAPLGQTWDPPVPATIVARAMLLSPGDLALFRGDDWERIEAANFVPVSRAAVRLTARNPHFQNS